MYPGHDLTLHDNEITGLPVVVMLPLDAGRRPLEMIRRTGIEGAVWRLASMISNQQDPLADANRPCYQCVQGALDDYPCSSLMLWVRFLEPPKCRIRQYESRLDLNVEIVYYTFQGSHNVRYTTYITSSIIPRTLEQIKGHDVQRS
jgi:hypothetical protein